MCRSRRELSNENLFSNFGISVARGYLCLFSSLGRTERACLLASIQPRTSPVKFARSPRTDHYYYYRSPRFLVGETPSEAVPGWDLALPRMRALLETTNEQRFCRKRMRPRGFCKFSLKNVSKTNDECFAERVRTLKTLVD